MVIEKSEDCYELTAHPGQRHASKVSWNLATQVMSETEVVDHLDLGGFEVYTGRHPRLGAVRIILSTVGQSLVLSEIAPRKQHHLTVVT